MESKINYTVVGIFVVVLTVIMVVAFFWLTTFRHDRTYKIYLVYMHEEVTGLSVQSPVRFNGVPVGYVKKIELDKNNPQLVKLTLAIADGTPLTTSTVAMLTASGITGIMYVGLKAKTVNAPPLEPKPGEKYAVIPTTPSLLMQLSQVLPEVTKNIKKIGESVTNVLSDENQKAITSTLKNLDTFTTTLSNNTKQLDRIMKSLDKTLQNTSIASEQFPEIMEKFNATLTSIQNSAGQINKVTRSARSTLAASRVLVQNFSDQVMPSAQQLMEKLNMTMGSLQHFMQALNRNPSMLIRGKIPEQPGPGER